MPKVGNYKFPYNEKGMRDAQKYAEATGQEIKYDEISPGGFIMIDPETQMPIQSTMSKMKDAFGYGSYQEGGEVNKWTDDKGLFQGGMHKRLFGRSRDALQNLFGGGLKKRARRFAEKFDPESNKDVLKLQQMMNKLGVTDSSGEALEEDSMFGNKTLSALRKLQGVEQEAPVQDTPVPEQSPIYDKPELSWTQGDNYLSQDFHKDTPMSFPRYQEGGSVDEGIDWSSYGKGNAWVWGKIKGEDDLMGIGKRVFDMQGDVDRYSEDPGFKEFVNATTTQEKLEVLKKYFPEGPKSVSLFGYNPEGSDTWDWDGSASSFDELFKRHNAVIPTQQDNPEGMQRGGRVKKFGY